MTARLHEQAAKSGSLATMAYQRLRADIIGGRLPPGEKLHIRQLSERYGTGLAPIREALNRLSREGLVTQKDHRGFCCTPISDAHLEELTRTRQWLYEIGLRQSIARGTPEWEEAVLLSYHRLSRASRSDPRSGITDDERERAHRVFHSTLISACGSPWLIDFCEQLFDAADRYRHLARLANLKIRMRTGDEHKQIMEATLARDADKAVRLLDQHITRTAALVRGKCGELTSALIANQGRDGGNGRLRLSRANST